LDSPSGGVFTAYRVGTNNVIVVKQKYLGKQPKKDVVINEASKFLSFFHMSEPWVVVECAKNRSLTDFVTVNFVSDRRITFVSTRPVGGTS